MTHLDRAEAWLEKSEDYMEQGFHQIAGTCAQLAQAEATLALVPDNIREDEGPTGREMAP